MVFAIRMKEGVVIVERRDELMAVGVVRPSERSATRHGCGTIGERSVMGRLGKGHDEATMTLALLTSRSTVGKKYTRFPGVGYHVATGT
jgi:hypothetical protein